MEDGERAEPGYRWLARVDPSYERAYRSLLARVWNPGSPSLPLKYREIVAAVVLAYRGHPACQLHLRNALAHGATLREMLEAFQAAAILGGFPVLHDALPHLEALHAEFGDGILGAAQPVPPEEAEDREAAARTKAVSGGMREWAWLDGVDPDFDAARRAITAFAWTPPAPALPVKMRELVACVVLAYRAFPTLDAHLRRAIREGASVAELLEALEAAALPGGFPVLHYALPFLATIEREIAQGRFA